MITKMSGIQLDCNDISHWLGENLESASWLMEKYF